MSLWINPSLTPDPSLTTPERTERIYALTLSTFKSGSASPQWHDHPLCLQALHVAVFTLIVPRISHSVSGFNKGSITTFCAERPEWVNGLVDFALGQGTEAEMDRLCDGLSKCKCSMEDSLVKELHGVDRAHRGFPSIKKPLQVLPHAIFQFLTDLVMGLKEHNKLDRLTASNAKVKEKDAGLARLAYYFRDAPRTMLLSSAFWYARSASPIILGYLSAARKLQPHVFDTHGGVLGPPIARLVSQQIEHHIVVRVLGQGFGEYNAFNDAYAQDAMHVVSFVHGMASKSVDLMAQVGFFRPCAKEMYDTICRTMIEVDREATSAQAHSIMKTTALPLLAWTATALHRWITSDFSCAVLAGIYMGQKDPKEIDSKREKVVIKYMKQYGVYQTQNKAHSLYSFLQSLKNRRECTRVGCGKGPASPKSKPFDQCSGCKLCSYCSVECQRVAWRDPTFPHKAVCKHWGPLAAMWPKDRHALEALLIISTSTSAGNTRSTSGDIIAPLNRVLEEAALKNGFTAEQLEELYDGKEEFTDMIDLKPVSGF